MIKKIFIVLSLLVPMFCWADASHQTLYLKGLVKIELPSDVQEIKTFNDMTVIKTKENKGFSYGIIDISKDYPKQKNYDFFYNVFNETPKTEAQSDWASKSYIIKKNINQNHFMIGLAEIDTSSRYKRNVAIIYSQKMDFAVEIIYPFNEKKYIEKIRKIVVKDINFE